MAFTLKSDLIELYIWEARRFGELSLTENKTTTGSYSETSTSSGVTYSGTDGQQGLFNQLKAVMITYGIFAEDWNSLVTFVNGEISEVWQEILEIKSKLDQAGIVDFANQTGYGAYFTFEDTDGINVSETTATINTGQKRVEFPEPSSFTGQSSGAFSNVNQINVDNVSQAPVDRDVLSISVDNLANNGSNYDNWSVSGTSTKSSSGLTFTDVSNSNRVDLSSPNITLANSTQYTMFVQVIQDDSTGSGLWIGQNTDPSNAIIATKSQDFLKGVGIYKVTFTTVADVSGKSLSFYSSVSNQNGETIIIKIFAILEGDQTHLDITSELPFGISLLNPNIITSVSDLGSGVYQVTLTDNITTIDNQNLSIQEADKILVLTEREFQEDFSGMDLRLYPSELPQITSDGAFSNVNVINATSDYQLQANTNGLWYNGSNVGITNVVGNSTVVDITTPVQVVNQAYSTQGNGGRKVVFDDDGNIYICVKDSATLRIYKSTDNGASFSEITTIGTGSSGSSWSIEYADDKLHTIWNRDTNGSTFYNRHALDGTFEASATIDSSQTSGGECSIKANTSQDKITAIFATKNATLPNSFNIRAVQGTISAGVVTWGSVDQVTNSNTSGTDHENPSVVYNNLDNPVVLFDQTTSSNERILARVYNGATWDGVIVFGTTNAYIQQNPSATSITPSVATSINPSYTDGLLIVAWDGTDATDTTQNNIRCKASSDNGATWFDFGVTNEKVTSGNTYNQLSPSVSWNNDGDVFIIWFGRSASTPGNNNIRLIERNVSTGYGSIEEITTQTVLSAQYVNSVDNYHNFEKPVAIWSDNGVPDVKLYGKYTIGAGLTLTLASNVTLTNGQTLPITGVFNPQQNNVSLSLNDVTDEYHAYSITGLSTDTQQLKTTGRNVNLDILTYSLR